MRRNGPLDRIMATVKGGRSSRPPPEGTRYDSLSTSRMTQQERQEESNSGGRRLTSKGPFMGSYYRNRVDM